MIIIQTITHFLKNSFFVKNGNEGNLKKRTKKNLTIAFQKISKPEFFKSRKKNNEGSKKKSNVLQSLKNSVCQKMEGCRKNFTYHTVPRTIIGNDRVFNFSKKGCFKISGGNVHGITVTILPYFFLIS